jgi:hexosaminidase
MNTPFQWLMALASIFITSHQHNNYSVIPQPLELIEKQGTFTIAQSTTINLRSQSPDAKELAQHIAQFFTKSLEEIQLTDNTKSVDHDSIIIDIDEKNEIEPEGYQLFVTPENILIRASTTTGAFWAFQTLRQLMPAVVELQVPLSALKITVPCVTITDAPRFSYRGLHLDVSRHFFPISFIKKYLDLMATYKLNVFHWHLTDDQGWRIEIKKYPKLQEIGAFRSETVLSSHRKPPHKYDGTPHGGFYTQEEIKEVVEYARQRHITIIPEIELPGHCLAALASYNELGCANAAYTTGTRWGLASDLYGVYCAGNENTFSFLEDVLLEVMELFPSHYIHIGGDEVGKEFWKACDKCQLRMQQENLKDENELQSYFIKRIEKFLNSHGRTIIGWDEILEGGVADNAVVMSWRSTEGALQAAQMNHQAILTPHEYLYFDYYQSRAEDKPFAIGGFTPLQKVYEYEPIPAELNEEQARLILGAQANVWTEYMSTSQQVEYMTFPRALALAELTWTMPENKNYDDFVARLKKNYEHLRALKVYYALYQRK